MGSTLLRAGFVAFDSGHRVVNELADRRLFGLSLEVYPARFGRNPEDVLRAALTHYGTSGRAGRAAPAAPRVEWALAEQ